MPTGDSISKFDRSFDMYTAKPSPIQQKRAQCLKTSKTGPVKLDSIESSKIQRLRLNPIKSLPKSLNIAGEKAVKIARAGRFVFYAIAMPPFFLLYALPKWVALVVLPPVLAQVDKGLEHAKKLMNKIMKVLTEGLSNPFRNILGRIDWKNKGVEKQNGSLLTYIGQGFRKIGQTIQKAAKSVAKPLVKAREVIREKFVALTKESKRVYEVVSTKVAERLNSLYSVTLQPVVNMILPKVQVIQQRVELGLKWGRENVKRLAGLARERLKPALDVAKEAKAWVAEKASMINQQLIQVAQPVINLCVPTMQFLKKHLSFGIQWLKHKPKEFLGNMHSKAKKFLNRYIPMLNDTYDGIAAKVKNFWKWFFGPFFKLLGAVFPFIPWMYRKLIAFLSWVKQGVVKVFVGMKSIAKSSNNRFVRGLNPIKNTASRSYEFFIDQGKKMLEAPVAYFIGLFHKGMGLSLQVLKVCALVIIGIGLVFKFWIEMLFDLSDEYGGWSRSRPRK
ncbi:MAG: hypothetical protein VX777_04460 [Chlamydiota bacterium]|nr:hypothetical protein [Chlamydiota bacterium]